MRSADCESRVINPVRRQLMKAMGVPLVAGALVPSRSWGDTFEPLNRYPRMVHEFFVAQVRALETQSLVRKGRLATREDAERHVADIRERIRKCFGPEPERTPLLPRVTGVVERDGYRIEKVIFESRPGFPVTANLYLPSKAAGKVPGVVGTCGHSTNGKAAEAYQAFSQGLVRKGYACLIYDPIGQGERLQYLDESGGARYGAGTREHLHAGNQQFLVGEFMGMWRAWDGIRALDYLLSRPEVDPARVGVTGNSGGGTMTTWLCGVEPRWSMAAPSCFVTTFRRNLENELPADTEQCPPRSLALGLDHDDFLAAMAPKPVMILAKERDYFDVRGSEEAYARLKRLYHLLGHEENIAMFAGPTTHGYTQENREAMYGWFNRASGTSDVATEPELKFETDETLWCTPAGQVAGLPGNRTVFSFTQQKAAELANRRGSPRGQELRRRVAETLKLPARDSKRAPDYRIWRYLGSRGYPSASAIAYAVETEPGIQAIVYHLTEEAWHSRPAAVGGPALLYVSDLSSDEELRSEPWVRKLIAAAPQIPVFTCDVRGIGESKPDTCSPNSYHGPYGNDYFYAIHSIMLDRPYVGQRTHDLLRVLDWLESLGHQGIHLAAKGWGTIPATFAALLAKSVTRLSLKNPLTSYEAVASSEDYDWPLSSLLPNVLEQFDLPDCYQELSEKHLERLEPWGAEGRG